MSIRVLVADDQPLVRSALRMSMSAATDLETVGEAGSGEEAIRLTEQLRPDVVMMDIRMPRTDGIEATRRITQGPANARVLVLTTFDDDECVHGALRAGASGFLVKDMAVEDILAAIRVVASGDALLAPSVTRRLIRQFTDQRSSSSRARLHGDVRGLDGITGRERQVLQLVGSGMSNQEIAAHLSIGVATAKSHVNRLLSKLNARDRVQLVIIAYDAGLVTPDR